MSDRRGFLADLGSDHAALARSRRKYDPRYPDPATVPSGPRAVLVDLVTHVGFQQLAVFRLAQALHRRRLTPLAMVVSRLIRHLYGAEMHWAADVHPGVVLVHGSGLVISREATVGSGAVLSQHVTLGISRDRTTGESGAPTLEADVHVAPGAVLLGPIVVGEGTKVSANTVLDTSVAPFSLVQPAAAVITERRPSPPSAH